MPRSNPFKRKKDDGRPSENYQASPIASFLHNLFSQHSEEVESATLNELTDAISSEWDGSIAPTLLRRFGRVPSLYVIFYADSRSDDVVLEVWDPNYADTKPSEVFRLRGLSRVAKQLPAIRSKATINTLLNWY